MTKSKRTPAAKPRRAPRTYTPLADALAQPLTFADTELSEGIQRIGVTLLKHREGAGIALREPHC